LLVGLITLLLLNILWGITAIRKSNEIYREVLSNQERYRENDKILTEIQTGIYVVSVLVRDFLLDMSPVTSEDYRQRMLQIRSSLEGEVGRLRELTRPEDHAILNSLQAELDSFWQLFNPVFEWTLLEKMQNSSRFLHHDLRPRRRAVFSMTEQIAKLNSGNMASEDENTRHSKEKLDRDLWRMTGLSLLLGTLVVAGSIFRVSQLEKRSELQHRATQEAEQAMRGLSHRLVRAQEEERRALSRELHDEVGQILTALRMELGNLEQLRSKNGAFDDHMREAKSLAEQTLRTVRDMSMGLRPSMLDDLGLGPAVEWQTRDFARRTGVPVAVELDGELAQAPEAHRTCIYRIVQEALTNCARHAHATHIRIALHGGEDLISLSVQDDGVGLAAPSAGARAGIGLLGIEERVRELGGTTRIQSQPRKGTLLSVEIPLGAEVKA
jgi:signal transduction histidine kinase